LLYQENWEEPLKCFEVNNGMLRGAKPLFFTPPSSPPGEGGHRGMGLLVKTGE